MGCDIHMYVETRHDEKWHITGKIFDDEYSTDKMTDEFDVGRCYSLFGILAGVRGSGEKGLPQIDDPRGLPKNISAEVKAYSDTWGIDGHSHSWMSFTELQQYAKKHKKALESEDAWGSEWFFTTGLKLLRDTISDSIKSKDIRIVFWFDN